MFTCISCRIAFENADEQRSHFGTDWHRYNMKRRVANLPPVSAHAFNDKVVERREQNAVRPDPRGMFCSSCSKSFSSENSYRSHVLSKKHREREASTVPVQTLPVPDSNSHTSASTPAHGESSHNTGIALEEGNCSDADGSGDEVTEDADGNGDDDVDIEARIAASRRRISPRDCLFCNQQSQDLPSNIEHMSRIHSFFIPDQDILVDLPGLIAYLGEKVAVGNLCLYCPDGGREFGSLEAVRKHMIDKAHCKLAYNTEHDRAELADFYDFGGGDEEDDESDWEDVEDDGSGLPSEGPRFASDGLSLVLPSGRVLGHRALKVYYSQRLRSHGISADDGVKSKVALVRERLSDPSSALVPVAGGHGSFGRGLQVVKARNAGEASWAKKQGKSFNDQRVREQFRTKVGFRNNNQKHFRDPLLQ